MKPRWFDYLVLAISLAFVAMSALSIAAGRGDGALVAGMLFFAACAAVLGWDLAQKRRAARQAAEDPAEVAALAGEVLVADARRPAIASATVTALGTAMALLGGGLGAVFVGLSLVMALLGAGALVAMALGWGRGGSLRFTPEALWISDGRALYPVSWDMVEAVDLAEHYQQPVLRLLVHDAALLIAGAQPQVGQDHARARERVARQVATSRAWVGADVAIFPRSFAVDPVVLLRAVELHVEESGLVAGADGGA